MSDYDNNNEIENFIKNYLRPHESEFLDPSTGQFYTFLKCGSKVNCGTGVGQDNLEIGEIYYNSNADCEAGRFVDKPFNATNFILLTRLETGGLYCFSSSN